MGIFSRFGRPAWEKAADRARRAAAAGDHGLAVREFDEASKSAPDDARSALADERAASAAAACAVNVTEGEARERAGHVERAIEHYELAREFAADPEQRAQVDEALARLTRARRKAADEAGRPATVESDVELDDDQTYGVLVGGFPDAVADAYEERDAAFRSAFVAMHRGEVEKALEQFRALATDDDAPAWTEIGRCLRALDDLPGALEAFLRAESLAPEWNHVRLAAADTALAAGDIDTAEEVLQRAVDYDDGDPAVYFAICQAAIRRQDPGYGLEAADAGLAIDPANRGLLLLRARLLEIAGRVDEALAGYEARVQQSWRYDAQEGKLFLDYDAAYFAAHLYRRLGRDPKRAAELFRGLMAVSEPGERWAHELGLADVLLVAGAESEAHALLDELDRVVPADQKLARCRIADLAGRTEELEARVGALDDEQRQAWESAQAERVRV